jgi:hypothetical protein
MFQEFLMKKMLKAQGVPENQIDMVVKLVQKNPELFKKIASEVKVEMDKGKDQMKASMEVMSKYKSEIEQAMKSSVSQISMSTQ